MIYLRYAYVAFVLFLTTIILSPLQIVALWRGWKIARKLPRYWHVVACFVLGIRIHVHGEIERQRPLLLSANHTTWLDIVVLGRVAEVSFIAKSEVKTWPIFGLFARLQNSVFIERADKRGTGRQVGSIADRLAGGEIIILFPEGTTSDGNRIYPIKYSLFGAASSAVPLSPTGKVHVQPVAVAGTRCSVGCKCERECGTGCSTGTTRRFHRFRGLLRSAGRLRRQPGSAGFARAGGALGSSAIGGAIHV